MTNAKNKQLLFLTLLLVVLAVMLPVKIARAADVSITQGMDAKAINAAIKAANSGDTVIFEAGAYKGKITVAVHDIRLMFKEGVNLKSADFTIGDGKNECIVWLGSEKPVALYKVTIKAKAGLYTYGILENSGKIVNDGTFAVCGQTFTNNKGATITSNDTMRVNDGGVLINKQGGKIVAQSKKQGYFHVGGWGSKLVNEGTLEIGPTNKKAWLNGANRGTIENSGTININYAMFENITDNWEGNKSVGKITNAGTINIKKGGMYNDSEFINSGTINNEAEFIDVKGIKNTGKLTQTKNGVWTDFGSTHAGNSSVTQSGTYFRGFIIDVKSNNRAVANFTLKKNGEAYRDFEIKTINNAKYYRLSAGDTLTVSSQGYEDTAITISKEQMADLKLKSISITLNK